SGVRFAARHIAFAANTIGVSFTPAKDGCCLSRSRMSIIAVTSTLRNSVTCGAVNALSTIAWAVALRTPLIGTRVSREPSSGAVAGAGRSGVSGVAVAATPLAACCTSSLVITPPAAEPVTLYRFTPRSLASFRTGGFANGTRLPAAGVVGSPAGVVDAAAGEAPETTSGEGDVAVEPAAGVAVVLRGRRVVELSVEP